MRILVVDDESGIRGLVTRWLETMGYETSAAVSAEQASRELSAPNPDIVFADVDMPGRDGLWLAGEIRRKLPGTAIVMMTGSLDGDVAKRITGAGAMDLLRKPFTRAQLAATLGRAIVWRESHCKMSGCDGEVSSDLRIGLRTGCASSSVALACAKCGRLHWEGGLLVFNRQGHAGFLESGQVVNRDEEGGEMSRL